MNVVFLLDLSDSVSLASRERAYRFVAEAAKSMKSGDRNSVIAFGEQAVVRSAARRAPGRRAAEGPGRRARHNIFQAIQLALAMLPPGQANRIVMLTTAARTPATRSPKSAGRQGCRRGHLLRRVTAHLHAGGRRRGARAPARGQVRRAVPGEGGRVEPQGYRRGALALPEQRVPGLAGRAPERRQERFQLSPVARRERNPRLPGGDGVEGDTIEEHNRAVGAVVVRGRPQVLLAERDRNTRNPWRARSGRRIST